jgi:hypothetical protein
MHDGIAMLQHIMAKEKKKKSEKKKKKKKKWKVGGCLVFNAKRFLERNFF